MRICFGPSWTPHSRTAIRLGYLDLVCKVQGVKRRPRPDLFEGADFPALEIKVGSAQRGTSQEKLLAEGKAARTLLVEVTFRDQVYAFQELHLTHADVAVQAFTLEELIAEKFRALLQQPGRRRNRRQDVYDIAFLIDENPLDDAGRATVLETLVGKCRTRGIEPSRASLDDPEIRERAQKEWDTLGARALEPAGIRRAVRFRPRALSFPAMARERWVTQRGGEVSASPDHRCDESSSSYPYIATLVRW